MPLFPKCRRCNMSFGLKDSKNQQVSRLPLMLDCGHTFCSDCLSRLARQQRTHIACPKCSKSTALTEDSSIKSLWPDIYVNGLLTSNRSGLPLMPQMQEFLKVNSHSTLSKPKQVNCEECAVKAVTCRCVKCDVLLCGQCYTRIHSVSNVLKQHQAVPYNSRTPEISYGENKLQMCSIHKRVNEYYCNEEELAFCSACVAQGLHKDHLVMALEDKEKSDSGELDVILGEVTSVLKHSKQSSQLLSSFESACHSHGSRLVEKLQDHFLQLHSSLQARENSLINELINLFHTDIEPLAGMQEDLLEKMKKTEAVIQDAKSVIAGTHKRLVSCQLMDPMKEIVENPCHVAVTGFGNLEIQFQCEDDELLDRISSHGRWDGKFVKEIKFDKLCDVPSNAEVADYNLPEALSSGSSCSDFSAAGSSDLNGTSPSDDPDPGPVHDPKPLQTNITLVISNNKSKTGSRFKTRSEVIHVSHIFDPCHFYVNLSKDAAALESLSRNINNHCSYGGRRDIPNTLGVGDQVLAQFGQDGQWYRARVLEIYDKTPESPSQYRVVYTDYGNAELVPLERIRNTHPKFLQPPVMAKRCSLVDIVPVGGGKWTTEAISAFARVTKDRPMLLCLIKETPDLWYVDLSRPASEEIQDDGPASVRDVLIFLHLACFVSPYSLPSAKTAGVKRRQYLTPKLPQVGDSVSVLLTYIVSPGDFYVHLNGSDVRHLHELMMSMRKTYDQDKGELYTLFCPAKGMLCAAQYGSDGMWYRAEVVDPVGSGQVKIYYVDFGNQEVISVWNLKKLLDAFMILPAQAIHCQLADVDTVNETGLWSEEATEFLSKMLNEMDLTMKVKETIDRSTLSVYLHSEMLLHSVNTSLISNGWAVATGPGWELPKTAKSLYKITQNQKKRAEDELSKLKAKDSGRQTDVVQGGKSGTTTTLTDGKSNQEKPSGPVVTVSHIESPGEFFIQAVDDGNDLQRLVADMNSFFNDGRTGDSAENVTGSNTGWKSGDMCAVISPDDQRWYRAQIRTILESTQPTAEVCCVDFGYKFTENVASLRLIPDRLNSARHFATRCRFVDIVPAGDPNRWSQTSCDAFKSLVTGKTCYLVEKDAIPSESGSIPVDLILEIRIKGGAITPDFEIYQSVSESLRDKGLALKRRTISKAVQPAEDQQRQGPVTPVLTSLTQVTASDTVTIAGAPNASASAAAQKHDPEDFTGDNPLSDLPAISTKKPDSEDSTGDNLSPDLTANSALEHDLEDSMDDYPPPELPSSEKLVLGVTHVDQDCVIYGQEIKKDLRPLREFTDYIDNHYKNSLPNIGHAWKAGQKVVAQYTVDDGFYRAKILSISNNFAEVFFVDYGNRERLSTERLRPPLFIDKPAQCYKCIMPGLKQISLEKTSKFLSTLLVGKFCDVHIQKQPEPGWPLIVNVVTPEINDLAQYLCEHGYVSREESPLNEKGSLVDEEKKEEEEESEEGEELESDQTVGKIVNPAIDILPSSATASNQMPGELSENVSSRASTTSSIPSVESLQCLSASILASSSVACPPAFPHPCGYGSWVGDVERCEVMTAPQFPSRKKSSPYLQQPLPKPGEVKMMIVTQVDAPNIVYLQNMKLENVDVEGVSEMNRQLERLLEINLWYSSHLDECSFLTREQLKPGQPCIARYSLDDCWYRAEVIDVQPSEESLEVFLLFVDYGSSESITQLERLRTIPTDHLSLPAQAILCHLSDVVPRNTWSQSDVNLVEQSVKDKVLVADFKSVECGQISVDLFDQDSYMSGSEPPVVVYKSLIDDGILALPAENVSHASMEQVEQETCRNLSSLDDCVAVKCSSESSSRLDETEDDAAID